MGFKSECSLDVHGLLTRFAAQHAGDVKQTKNKLQRIRHKHLIEKKIQWKHRLKYP